MNDQRAAQKPVTLAEVAKEAGVSQMTASKVMRRTGSISEATREKVRKVAAELGYVPNRLAGALSSRTSDIVAVMLPSINDAIFGDVVSGINAVLRPRGYITFLGETHFDGDVEEEILQTVLSLHPAALILTGGLKRSDNTLKMLSKWSCPTIQIWDDVPGEFDGNIAPSHVEAGRLVARHFVDRTVSHPAYIGAELDKDICADRRRAAYCSELQTCGLRPVEVVRNDLPRRGESGRVLVEEVMQSFPETDAIYCLNDAMALGALAWLHEHGFEVPQQVAVAGFNGISQLHSVRTRLTTVAVERYALGQAVGRSILDALNGKPVQKVTLLDTKLVVGNTT